jgi:hypothetical protein
MPRFSTSFLLAFFIVTAACSRSQDIQSETVDAQAETGRQDQGEFEPMPSIEDAWRAAEQPEGPAEAPLSR